LTVFLHEELKIPTNFVLIKPENQKKSHKKVGILVVEPTAFFRRAVCLVERGIAYFAGTRFGFLATTFLPATGLFI
jgi:hypothetical protein